MNVNDFGHVSIVFEYDMMCARVYRLKCFNFSNIRIRIRTDLYINIRIHRMRILINSVASLVVYQQMSDQLYISSACTVCISVYLSLLIVFCVFIGFYVLLVSLYGTT